MNAVNEYVASLPPDYRIRVDELRAIVIKAAPNATERFSYGVIMYKTEYDLVGIGTAKGVVSLYAMGVAEAPEFKNRLGNFKIKGKTLHLPVNEPWDEALLFELIQARAQNNQKRAANITRQNPKRA